jgi:DNA helicase HerA-like ATPase
MALEFLGRRPTVSTEDISPRHSGDFRFPGPSDRVTVMGMTGSGKSTFALWLFAESADFNKKPWVLVDFKGDDIITRLPIDDIKISGRIPTEPGVYRLSPDPRETGDVEGWLWRAWERGDIGLFFDEAYMVPEYKGSANAGGAFKAILTQGRSKNLPVYILAQRPVDLNRHVYSENTFLSLFRLKSRKDFEKILDSVPDDENVWTDELKLPEHWSRWYDARRNKSFVMKPSPPPDEVIRIITERIGEKSKRAI